MAGQTCSEQPGSRCMESLTATGSCPRRFVSTSWAVVHQPQWASVTTCLVLWRSRELWQGVVVMPQLMPQLFMCISLRHTPSAIIMQYTCPPSPCVAGRPPNLQPTAQPEHSTGEHSLQPTTTRAGGIWRASSHITSAPASGAAQESSDSVDVSSLCSVGSGDTSRVRLEAGCE